MNRKQRRAAKVAHKKSLKTHNVTRVVTEEKENLFDKVYRKMTEDVPVKCQGIYESVFCKG